MPNFGQLEQTQRGSRRKFLLSGLGVSALIYPATQSRKLWIPLESHIPRPKFHIGQEVIAAWENGDLNCLEYGKAVVVGMAFSPDDYEPGWHYWHRWIEHLTSPYMVGRCEGDFFPEYQFKALD